MKPFIVNPHGRLQEWVADEKGYFKDAGLENYTLSAHSILTKNSTKQVHATSQVEDNKVGAYQSYESGRDASISCACHWTVNMAASDDHGKLWGESYSVSPCAIFVPSDSDVHTPEDLAGIEVHVGYQSGSHYTTIQALEPFLKADDIKLKFGGTPSDRIDQLIDGLAPAATVFGPQLYMAEQLGFRKILDCTFMISAMIPEGVELKQVAQYYEALRLAQADIDQMHQPYLHYYLNELPKRHAKLIDVKRFGPGERLVFEPYSRSLYENTQLWIRERGIFDESSSNQNDYLDAVIRIPS
jgi:hypothetical protein